VTYQTQIPDDFRPPQFKDEAFHAAHALYHGNGYRPGAPWVVALPRPELDPTSRTAFHAAGSTGIHGGGAVSYELGTKVDKVAMMHVIAAGAGRVRLGFREAMPVAPGDMVIVNLREAGHWVYYEGQLFYQFTGDVAMARVYRTTKTLTPPEHHENEHIESYRDRRKTWEDELYWNISDVLNDYVVLGNDPNAATEMRNGKGSGIILPDQVLVDGTRSDNARDNRFPIVYRRVLGVGPGRCYRKESDLGFPDYVVNRSELEPGDMMAYCKTVRAAAFRFQSMPLEIMHASSMLSSKTSPNVERVTGAKHVEIHESCGKEIPWDVPSEIDPDEDATLRGLTG
jgi:hypothetical protein